MMSFPDPSSLSTSRSFIVIFLLTLSTVYFSACSENEQGESESAVEERILEYETTITFLNERGNEISEIEAAVADDDASRSQGLMDVHSLPVDAGMLFIFDDNQQRNFWMASTPLSLDIIFVNEEYEIVRIHRNTSPYSQESIPSELPSKYVVEVNAGYTMRHDINEGGRIQIGE
ncbi:DUF192 domain-containing protein [Rhodohalobacter sp. SW132]|uniref:DUF192 domain-containing protein n=1 Tax=Rhodohalobacter sp. SW132 TaxID=2293433 RepID=UPI001314C8AD|nr:DUF192 domain-containing protein [Rhodohalobacter sp. SW132]